MRPSSPATGLVGLTLLDGAIKRPLMLAVVLGLGCLTIAHGGPAGAPAADVVRDLLDGALQVFRNVHKIDPVVRLPIAIGFGCAVARGAPLLVERAPRLRTAEHLLLLAPLLVVLVLGRPYLQGDARTPGWDEIPSYWQETRSYLAEHAPGGVDGGRALVVPGSRFAQQEWGWTLDEPLGILGDAPMVSRSQVPLIPGESIRYLSALDQLIATGRATEALVGQLARAGITHVVLRRDLLRSVTGSPHPGAAAVSLVAGRTRAGGRVRPRNRRRGSGRGVRGARPAAVAAGDTGRRRAHRPRGRGERARGRGRRTRRAPGPDRARGRAGLGPGRRRW